MIEKAKNLPDWKLDAGSDRPRDADLSTGLFIDFHFGQTIMARVLHFGFTFPTSTLTAVALDCFIGALYSFLLL